MILYDTSFLDKFAAELQRRNIEVLPPLNINGGGKVGVNATHQFTAFKENQCIELINELLEVSPGKLQFVELVCPTKPTKYVKQSNLLIKDNILLRYIKMIDIKTDEDVERWDALIKVS